MDDNSYSDPRPKNPVATWSIGFQGTEAVVEAWVSSPVGIVGVRIVVGALVGAGGDCVNPAGISFEFESIHPEAISPARVVADNFKNCRRDNGLFFFVGIIERRGLGEIN
jgi:hypothetical protein